MKFLIDRCAGRRLAEWLRHEGFDVLESRELGADPGDRILLARAAAEGRILVTMDKDFGAFVFAERASHAGLVRLPDLPVDERLELMDTILEQHGQDLGSGAIVTVRGDRIRVSEVPDPD